MTVSHAPLPPEIQRLLLAQARGLHQRRLVRSEARWSLCDTGSWKAQYLKSRRSLIGRIREVLEPRGWSVALEKRGKHEGKAGPGRPMLHLVVSKDEDEWWL